MRRLQAQMRRRRDGSARGEDGVGELEKRIGTSVQALLERSAKGAQEIGMFHNDPLCRRGRRAATLRDRSPSSRLKRKLREERALTHKEAAELAKVSHWTLIDLESGKRAPYMPTVTKIARAYGVPLEELVEE